jgi:hypothetical protein
MRGTHAEPTLAHYRDWVTELMEAGKPFGAVEDAIEEAPGLNQDAKAALWLLAFSLRDPSDQVSAARAHLSSVN